MTLRHPYMNAIATAAMLMAAPALALTIGQTDTFEDGTTNGWTSGVPNPLPPQNVATGGPGGANDNYLQLRSSGTFGAGSRLVAFNLGQWAGDYGTAGAGSVVMDVNNFGATDLSLRLLFTDLAGTNAAVTPVVTVPSGSGWMEVQFAIKATDLVVLLDDRAVLALAGQFHRAREARGAGAEDEDFWVHVERGSPREARSHDGAARHGTDRNASSFYHRVWSGFAPGFWGRWHGHQGSGRCAHSSRL